MTPWYYGVVPVPSSNFHSGLGFSEVGFQVGISLDFQWDFQARKLPFHGKSLEIPCRGGKSYTGGLKVHGKSYFEG